MKRKFLLILVAVIIVLIGLWLIIPKYSPEIIVSGIDFKPYLYDEDGKSKGIDADISLTTLENAGIKSEYFLSKSWDEVYDATLSGPNRAMLGLTYTKERKDLFKWVGPTSKSAYVIFAKAGADIQELNSIDDCKKIESIAVVDKNWEETLKLKELGFCNLIYFDSYKEAVEAFKQERVSAIASDRAQFKNTISKDYYVAEDIKQVFRYFTSYHFIAFSKDVSDKVVKRCQTELNTLIMDGSVTQITGEYISNVTKDMIPGIVQLHTEIDPPYNYYPELTGTHTALIGSSVEIVNEIQSGSNYINPINVGPWSLAYNALQYMPNYALFTTARTAEREDLFQWVGPISATSLCFHTNASSGITIKSLDEAKALGSIATPEGWFSYDFLVENGFKNILSTAKTSEEAIEQLVSGEADALFLYETGFNWLCDEMGIDQSLVSKQFKTGHYEYYIAFSLGTSPSLVAEWQERLDKMKADGRFEKIWKKWYAAVPVP